MGIRLRELRGENPKVPRSHSELSDMIHLFLNPPVRSNHEAASWRNSSTALFGDDHLQWPLRRRLLTNNPSQRKAASSY